MGETIIRKCAFCGKDFIAEQGSWKKYCTRRECENARQRDRRLKRKGQKPKETIGNCTDLKDIEKIVYKKDENSDWSELIEIARKLGKLRYELVQQIMKVNLVVKESNEKEQDLLHKLEMLEEVTNKEAIDLALQIKSNRENRRIFKNAQFLIGGLLKGLTIKNPEKFVQKGIEIISNPNYEPRILNELFEKEEEEEIKDDNRTSN